jgi:ferredoxin
MKDKELQVVFTNKARCRDCYRCIRNCPVKAIEMKKGQASVIDSRCIHCGTCIAECPQKAKTYRREVELVRELLKSGKKVAASIAPSFASFYEGWERVRIPSALRKIGFSYIAETSVGAYYTSQITKEIFNQKSSNGIISSACPAVVSYIESITLN